MLLATGGYSGYAPRAPGTCGSVVGLLLFLLLASLPAPLYLGVLAGCTALGIWVAGAAEQLLHTHDAPVIVIDEIVGMLLTYYAMPVAWLPLLIGFVGFRICDIWKPFPCIERLPGGWGIMLDDLLAALLAQGSLRLLLLYWPV
ncbi:MAG: phosphatidylglycerophosphatase A [Candidatus Tectomicrobia bacterium]|uniref:Phosphatidylglycerophosphatase A n=1 Tax=Tectimicrobiota bacterium TaxID=2528274 RepID=A0A938B5S9_UNCTE|nr:phosphatidylglycerophosphatase A [Candidatus Tectomicrobia bacterium]